MKVVTKIDTRYPDCDQMGIVHHAVYPIWYEIARMELFEAMGIPFSKMSKLHVDPAMVDLHIQYKAVATYPQTLYITTSLGEYAPKKLELLYEIHDESGKLINTCRSFHIWTGADKRSCNLEENYPDIYSLICDSAEK